MTRNELLKEYSKLVSTNSAKARQVIKKLHYKRDPYLLQCIAQTYYDESLFDKNGSYRTYFVSRKLSLADKYILEAFKLNSNHAEILWVMGNVRNAYKQTDLAIYCFKKIIKLGIENIVENEEKSLWYAKMKVNDSKFQLYRLYWDKSNFKLSRNYLNQYKKGLRSGIKTIYKPLDKFLMDSPPLFVIPQKR